MGTEPNVDAGALEKERKHFCSSHLLQCEALGLFQGWILCFFSSHSGMTKSLNKEMQVGGFGGKKFSVSLYIFNHFNSKKLKIIFI